MSKFSVLTEELTVVKKWPELTVREGLNNPPNPRDFAAWVKRCRVCVFALLAMTAYWVDAARLGWPIAVALVLQLVFFRLLKQSGRRFREATAGYEAFDFQNRLTVAQIHEQLPAYTAESRRLYRRFFVLDFFFPLFASLFLSLLLAALLAQPGVPHYQRLLDWNAPLIAFLPALFDWGENACFLALVNRYPQPLPRLARAAIACKRLKLTTLFAVQAATAVLLVTTASRWF